MTRMQRPLLSWLRQRLAGSLRLLALLFTMLGCAANAALAQDEAAISAIRQLLSATQPGMVVESIEESPLAGLYQVNLEEGQTLFVSADAKYLIPGDLYQATPEGLVNLGELHRNELRKARIAALDPAEMIIYPAKGESKAELTVFTDVDCPYCRKLHGEIQLLNNKGITVRYLAFPRQGLEHETYGKMVNTWCADDPKAVFTMAKRGGEVPAVPTCDNPVAKHYRLGRELGVTGTPALVFEDGTMVPGYIPADTLAAYILGE